MAKNKKKSSFAGKVAKNAQESKALGASYGYLNLPRGVSVFSPTPGGRTYFDLLPYMVTDPSHPDRNDDLEIATPGTLWWKRPFKTHRNIGSGNDSVVCLTSVGKRCPICAYRAEMIKKGEGKELTDALKPSLRNLYVVVPKKDKKFEEKPHIMDISQFLFQNLLAEELSENEEYEIFPDLEEGLTLRVRWDSKTLGGGKPFAEANRIDFEERDASYDESILDDVPNLDEVLQILSADQLERKFFEMEDEDVTYAEVEEDVPEPENLKGASKPLLKEGKDDDDEGDEEVKKPVGTRSKAKPIPQKGKDEEEDEEEDTDNDKCIACQGTGKDSKGKTCRICRGTGEKKKPESSDKNKKSKCPHGYAFGIDCEGHDECFDCDEWDTCMDEKEANE